MAQIVMQGAKKWGGNCYFYLKRSQGKKISVKIEKNG